MREPLLLLHGALGAQSQFTELAAKLQTSFAVHTMSFEGHGGEPSSNDFSIAQFAQNVIDFLTAHSMDQVNVFGYSMGGYVALHLALHHPDKIKKIVTLGTKFQWDPESAQKEVRMLNPAKIEEKVPHFAKALEKIHAPGDWKEVMEKTAKMMIGMAEGAKLTDDDLKKIGHEAVIGIGSLDNMVTSAESEHAASLLPNAHLVKLEGVPHPIEKVDVEVLAAYIISNLP